MIVEASFLSSNNPPKDLKLLDETDVDFIHVDVMDGKFVKNKTMPFSEMSKIYKYTSKRLDIHLMVEDSCEYIKKYVTLNTEVINIHVESKNVKENLLLIKDYHINPGIVINPNTSVSELVPYLPLVKEIIVMSVEPGMGGQEFITDTELKIKEIKRLIKEYKLDIKIAVDGGIDDKSVKLCSDADIVVSGSYILNGMDYQERINNLR